MLVHNTSRLVAKMKMCSSKKVWDSENNALKKQKSEETKDKCCNQYLIYDVLRLIFKYLNARELSNASMVCRSWSEAANNEKHTRGPMCLIESTTVPEDADYRKDIKIEIIKKLRIKPSLGLLFIPEVFIPCFTNTDCYCKALPSNCSTITLVTHGIIMDDKEFEEDLEHFIGVFLPDLPNLRIKPISFTDNVIYDIDWLSESQRRDIKKIKSVFNTPAKGRGISKCLLLFCNWRGRRTALKVAYALRKCYKSNELPVWGGVAKYGNICNAKDSKSITFEVSFCTAIPLVGPFDTWSLIIDKTHNTKERVEQRMKLFRNRICLKRHSIGLMFACCARGKNMFQESNVESSIFKKLFPTVPLAGCFGDGEFGTNKILNEPPDNKRKSWYKEISTVFLIITYD
ncbi:F-box only protein 22-like [Megachile rotundata]|uniref:F-box only protein 22-like n=1 Tax=Megachile rotundata TaxID=143995 RepID=UPI000614CD91|nr:PREDICTED: F-box only protein 22-like [Megachile rotundata]